MILSWKNDWVRWVFTATIVAAGLAVALFNSWWPLLAPIGILVGIWGWHNPSVLFYLLLISLPLSVEFSFSDQLGTDLPDEPLMLAVSVLSVLYLVYRFTPFRSRLWHHPLLICLLAWIGWMTITTMVSTTPWISFKFLLAKSWYIGAFLLAPLIWLRDQKSIRCALYCLFVPLFLLALLSVIRHAFEGFSFITSTAVVQPYFRNHVVYSAMLVTLVPVLFFSRRFTQKKQLWDAAMILVLVALFFSYARGAWLALFVGIGAYLLLRNRLLVYGYVVVLLLSLLTIVWLKQGDRYLQFAPDYRTTIFHSDFQDHWRATYQGKDVSSVERFYRWIAGVRMVEEKPLIGFGPSSFYTRYRQYTVPAYKTWVSNNPDRSTVHNYFLLTAVEQGIPGLIIFLILFGALLFYAEKLYHRYRAIWTGQLAAGIAVIVVMLGVVNFWSDLIETDKIGSLFFLSIALLLILDHRSKEDVGANPIL
ncbi:MAG: O-antigen ligase family protein [Bacteroidota bacterium]|jgi:O-antigen ligase